MAITMLKKAVVHHLPLTNGRPDRIHSIDLLRGVVMIIMALDHVRDYFHADSTLFSPEDLTKTNPAIFFTRWITHFCAPVFVMLAGTSAFLSGQRKTKKELAVFLITRGLWLLLLEFTVVNFAWSFNIRFQFIGLAVIWTLGLSMIVLAGLIHLRKKFILIIGVLIVAGHNLLDNIHIDGFLWSVLHEAKYFQLDDTHVLRVTYPVLPWIGIISLGYCLGSLYAPGVSFAKRKRFLLLLGILGITAFIILRFANIYGDLRPWSTQTSGSLTVLSFFNTTKYPPSLIYTLMTLAPAMILLAYSEKWMNGITKPIIHIGRVPMFYYLLHVYLIHLLAMVAAELSTGFHWYDMIFERRPWYDPHIDGYGFSLGVTYLVWIGIVVLLYPLCKWYDRYKTAHKEKWWLSYL